LIDRAGATLEALNRLEELEFMKKLCVLLPLWPVFMSYVLGFIYVGICWNKLGHSPTTR